MCIRILFTLLNPDANGKKKNKNENHNHSITQFSTRGGHVQLTMKNDVDLRTITTVLFNSNNKNTVFP